MALEFTVDSTDGMDDGIAALYSKGDDGKFTLDLNGGPKAPDNTALKKALDVERARNKSVKQWEALGKTPDEIKALVDAQATAEEAALKKAGDFESIRKQDTEKWEKERDSLMADNKAMGAVERKAVIENRLTTALATAGFTKEGLTLLPNTLSPRIKIEVVDGVRETRIYQADGETLMAGSGKDGAATFEDLASEVAKAFPSLVTGQGNGGGGKPPHNPDGSNSKTIKVADFDALSPAEQAKTIADGIIPVD